MSKVKSPDEKKQLSYLHDRRNTFGENQKSSRKNIPRSKQRAHQQERRLGKQIGAMLDRHADDIAVEKTLDRLADQVRQKQLKAFRKSADTPLGVVIDSKRQRDGA